MGAIKSINHYTLSATAGNQTATQDLSGLSGVNLSYCVPFASVRVDTGASNQKDIKNYNIASWITTGDTTLHISRDGTDGAITAEVYVVEFDSTKCNVHAGSYTWSSGSGYQTTSQNISGAAPTLTGDAFLYFGFFENAGTKYHSSFAIRGRITSSTQVTFDRDQSGGTADLYWYVVEETAGDFAVTTTDITIADTASTSSDTGVSTTLGRTMLLGSYRVDTATTSFSNADNSAYSELTSGTNVTVTRAGTAGTLTYHGQLVEFTVSDGTEVSSGKRNQATSVAQDDVTLSPALTDYTNAFPIRGGVMGTGFGGADFSGVLGSDIMDSYVSMQLTSNSNLRIEHGTDGGESGQDIPWQVIEFTEGGAPPATPRRVMVIS